MAVVPMNFFKNVKVIVTMTVIVCQATTAVKELFGTVLMGLNVPEPKLVK